MIKKIKTWHLGLVVLFLSSAFIRFYQFSSRVMFLGDQGRDVLRAYQILHGNLTFIGPMTSVGNFYLGPFYYYFIAPWLWIFHYSPVGPAFGIAFFSLLTIFLLYCFIFKIGHSHLIAFLVSLIYATNPIVVEYSRFSWNPNLLPFMSFLFLVLVYFYQPRPKKPKYLWLVFIGLIYGLILQLHYLAGLLILVLVFFYPSFWSKLKKNYLAWLILVLTPIIVESPFLAFEFKHHFREINNLIQTFSQPAKSGLISLAPIFLFKSAWRLTLDFSQRFLLGYPLFWLAFVFKYKKENLKRFKHFIFIFTLITLFSLAIYKGPLYDHYFAFAFFLPALTLTLFWLKFKENKIGQNLLIIYSLIIISFNLTATYKKIFKQSANNQIKTTFMAANLIKRESNENFFNIALIANNNNDYGYRFYFARLKAKFVPVYQKREAQMFIICEKERKKCLPLNNKIWEIKAFGQSKVRSIYSVNNITIYKLIHNR